ncbi:MAG: acyltransferase [Saprospiraceae bacterium]|nr:acyltransferase [Saprospiraceae bacterium]
MKERNQAIDALRGVAALMVMLLHLIFFFMQLPSIVSDRHFYQSFFQYVDTGRIGITIFFMISGFVISKSIRINEDFNVRKFFIRRFYRLYPLFWFSLILGLAVVWYLNGWQTDLSIIMANMTMVPAFFKEEFVIGLYWSLETELIFYLLVALFFVFGLLQKSWFLHLFTGILFLSFYLFIIWGEIGLYYSHWKATPYHLGLMMLGILFRYEMDGDRSEVRIFKASLSSRTIFFSQLILVLAVPLFMLIRFFIAGFDDYTSDAIAYLAGIFLFISGAYFWKKPPAFMVLMGTVSYSLYLLHPVVMHFVGHLLHWVPALDGGHLMLYLAATSALTIGIASLSYNWIEKPFNRLGHRLASQYRKDQDSIEIPSKPL